MQLLLKPKWLLLTNSLSIAILVILCYNQYGIIKSLLKDYELALWMNFAIALGATFLLSILTTFFLTLKKKEVTLEISIIFTVIYSLLLSLYFQFSSQLIPPFIPFWMKNLSETIVITFLLIPLLHHLIIIVLKTNLENKGDQILKNFLFGLGVIFGVFTISIIYFLILITVSNFIHIESFIITFTFIFIFVISIVLFLFFITKGIYLLTQKDFGKWQKYDYSWKFPLAVILPILGLAMNSGFVFNNTDGMNAGTFGNFSNIWYYILTLVNGLLIVCPNFDNKIYRIILYALRCITYSFTFYFFIVFIPFLPVSIFSILFFGFGLLLLTPLLLFVLHTQILSSDYNYLTTHYSKYVIIPIIVIGFCVIPGNLIYSYVNDKYVLKETLEYLYYQKPGKQYNIDNESLKRVISNIKKNKDRRNISNSDNTPYISLVYNNIVLDNFTLSDTKIKLIESVFFGTKSNDFSSNSERDTRDSVELTNINSNSVYDSTKKVWKSWINLELTNKDSSSFNSEYSTIVDLPEACLISNYYLYIGDKKEFGQLAEKKSALWVYSNIVNVNQDPGILYYLNNNKVALRVFPFAKKEKRKTGFEITHKEPVNITIDNKLIELGRNNVSDDDIIETNNFIYIPTKVKKSLQKVVRKPYFHFIVDISKDKKNQIGKYTSLIDRTLQSHQDMKDSAQISFVNSFINTQQLNNSWKETYKSQIFQGGFYLEKAINNILISSYKKDTYPVIVVLTDYMNESVIEKDFSELKFTYPEAGYFYCLNDNKIGEYSLWNNPKVLIKDTTHFNFDNSVLKFQDKNNRIYYIANNEEPSIILKYNKYGSIIIESDVASALELKAMHMQQSLHPSTSETEWAKLVKHSFKSGIMTPFTSYLVLENEAQKEILKRKQEDFLKSNKNFDLSDNNQNMNRIQRMSEPRYISILISLILVALLFKYKKSI